MNLQSSITEVKGVGAKTADLFAKLGVYSVSDILLRFPRTYISYPKMEDITDCDAYSVGTHAYLAQVKRSPVVKNTARMQITLLSIGATPLQLVWFRMPYIKKTLIPGKYYVFYGKIIQKDNQYVMEQPTIYAPDDYEQMEECLLPVYGLTSGISNRQMTKVLKEIYKTAQKQADKPFFEEYLPSEILAEMHFCGINAAMHQIHFPDSMETLIEARRRLVFDEFFLFLLGIQYQKQDRQKALNEFTFQNPDYITSFMEKLPYELTNAQKKTISEIMADMSGEYVMQRLIQGDVGSGKTIVAFLAMLWASYNGYQSAIMAPTEVLAKQHYESFVQMSKDYNLNLTVVLLTGSMTAKQKRETYAIIEEQERVLVIGTHALIQEKVNYRNLALVITDEQHRFGVHQREVFSQKGQKPHVIVMSATPIPRTLAIILYGDMDISVINELPAKRLPIKNCVVSKNYRPTAYHFILEQVKLGHQAYIICPLVEESESMDVENVEDYTKAIKEQFPSDVSIGMLHGKLKSEKKNELMEQFARNEIQILVSTTVVEVGVNVPNATVMMIENAEHFGLAQLHQLRGRVGRGDAQSYCIMINTSDSKQAKKRLEILNNSNDGFFIASEDLKLRGPGDFFGIRQSGELAFSLADIYQDADVLQLASTAVGALLAKDADLSMDIHKPIRKRMEQDISKKWEEIRL